MLSYNPPNLWNYGSKLDIDSLVNNTASKLSTLTIANNGFISSPIVNTLSIVNLSSINGKSVNNPEVSTISTFAINGLSSINGAAYFNNPVTDRTFGASPILITAITSGTANSLGSITLTTTFAADIDIDALTTFQTNSITQQNISVFVTLTPPGGVEAIVGNVYTGSLGGINHYITMPVLATAVNIVPGDSVVRLKAFSNVGSVFTATSRQLSGIGNLIKG